MNEELPRIQEHVYYGHISSHTDILEKFLSESGFQRYNPQVVVSSFSQASANHISHACNLLIT